MDQRGFIQMMFDEGWSRDDFSSVADWFAPSIRIHLGDVTLSSTLNDLKGVLDEWRHGFPDLTFVVHDVLSDGDRAAARVTLEGTHIGPWRGHEPTGNPVKVDHMFFFRFLDGKLVEVWEIPDRLQLHRQMLGIDG